MTITPALIGNFRTKFGPFIDALPEITTIANDLPFQGQERRPGEKLRVPFLAGISHGQTASRAGGLFPLNAAVSPEVPYAEIDGSTIMLREQFCWDDVYASLNGNSMDGGGNAGSYMDTMSLYIKSMGMGGSLYRDLALAYGPGGGSVLASNIGVISTVAGGTLATAQNIRLTRASYMAGLWPVMRNALVDIYQSDLTTLRVADVKILGVPDQNKTQVRMIKSGSGITLQANDVIVPKGWRLNSAIGLEAMANTQSGTLHGVNVSEIAQFRWLKFNAGGNAVTREMVREWCSRVAVNGSKKGGKLKVPPSVYASIAEQHATQNPVDNKGGGEKVIGESGLKFETPAGWVAVEVWDCAKQGQIMYIANTSNTYRVGTTDNTMRPIKGINEGFLTPLIDSSGAQVCMYSNQAPFAEQPWHNFIVDGIVSHGDVLDAA